MERPALQELVRCRPAYAARAHLVVVGGVHIQQVAPQPKIANLDCPTLDGGQVDISQTKDGMVSCSVTGSGLGLISAVSLEKGASKIVGKIKASGDGNSATLQFKPDDVCDADGTYALFLTYKSTSQNEPAHTDSGESALLSKQPSVDSAALNSTSLKLSGKCLDQLADLSLAPAGTENAVKGTGLAATSSEATATFATLADKTTYYLIYGIKNRVGNPIKAKSVTVTFDKPVDNESGDTTKAKKSPKGK